MTKKYFISFWLLLTIGMSTVVFNSCSKDDDPKKEETNPDNSEEPEEPGTIAVTGINMNVPTLTLLVGEEQSLTTTVTPDNATDKTVTWESSDKAKAIVDNTGKVTAIAVGSATITAKAGNQTAECIITVKDPATVDKGVMINGVKWATRNLDAPGTFAATPESPGMFYQWNCKTAWPVTGAVTGWDDSRPSGTAWGKSNDPSPAGWRVPTLNEIDSLLDVDYVTSEWTTQNGVNGRKFTDKASGATLFLPVVGYRDYDGTLDNADSYGFYWSSTQFDSCLAYGLFFFSYFASRYDGSRSYGFSVRCVAE